MNVEFRKKHNLPHRYEFEHFAHEGYVLYILDAEGFLINRTMYKIKPPDVEVSDTNRATDIFQKEVHWQQFDSSMEARVKEAVQKMVMRDLDFTETSLRRELDMGPKEVYHTLKCIYQNLVGEIWKQNNEICPNTSLMETTYALNFKYNLYYIFCPV